MQTTAKPSNEKAGNTSMSPANAETNDRQHPRCQKTNLITPISVMSSQNTVFEKQKQSRKHDWFKQFPWLEYNAFDNSLTCYV